MGFTPPRRVYKIEVGHGDYAGMIARIRSVPLGQFMSLADMAEGVDGEKAGAIGGEQFAQIRSLFAELAEALVSWNLEEPDGTPIPADLNGLLAQDLDLGMMLVAEWIGAMGGTSDFLGMTRRPAAPLNGEESMVDSLASLSRPLLSVPN